MLQRFTRTMRATLYVSKRAAGGAIAGAFCGAYWGLVELTETSESLAALAVTFDDLAKVIRSYLRGDVDDVPAHIKEALSTMLTPSVGREELTQIRETRPTFTNVSRLH